jgi:hypothetical protein
VFGGSDIYKLYVLGVFGREGVGIDGGTFYAKLVQAFYRPVCLRTLAMYTPASDIKSTQV